MRKLKSDEYIKDGIKEIAKVSLKYVGVPVKVIDDILKEKEKAKR